MTYEMVRTVFTYVIALVVILGSGLLLVVNTRIPSDQLLPFVTGISGAVIGFVFSDRSASAGSSRTLAALYTPVPDGTTAPPADISSGTPTRPA